MALSPEQTRRSYQSDVEQPTAYEISRLKPVIHPFAGRVGGNQEIVVDRSDPQNADLLKKVPDAKELTCAAFWIWIYGDLASLR
jgi:hypothetical protein